MKRFVFAAVLALAMLAVTTTDALAAGRIPVTLTEDGAAHGHPELRAGHLMVNPDIARLVINGALPDKRYLIVFMAHDLSDRGPCSGFPPVQFNAPRNTDEDGNLNVLLVDGWPAGVSEVVEVRVRLTDLDVDGNPTVYSSECVEATIG